MSGQSPLVRYKPLKEASLEESFESRRKRLLAGALYGFLGGTAFALFSGTFNALTHPDLPLYIDWGEILLVWAGMGFGLAFFGALIGWFTETLKGIVVGSIAMSLTVVAVSLIQSSTQGAISVIVFVAITLPVAACCVPVAWALRWLGERHAQTLGKSNPERTRGIVMLAVIALSLGLVPAMFQRMSSRAESSIRLVNAWLKQASFGETVDEGLLLKSIPEFKLHIGTDYKLSQRNSKIFTEGYDITILFSDGYKATCVVIAYGDQQPHIRECAAGEIENR